MVRLPLLNVYFIQHIIMAFAEHLSFLAVTIYYKCKYSKYK